MSSITKKANGRYLALWRDPSGKQCCRTFDRKVDAKNYLDTISVDVLQGRYVAPDAGRETLGDYDADAWAKSQPWRDQTRARAGTRHRLADQTPVRVDADRIDASFDGAGVGW